MTTASASFATSTAGGPDFTVGGERWLRRIPSATPFDLAVPAVEGDSIRLTVTASAEPRVHFPIHLDVWVLDSRGRDRRAISGAHTPVGIPGWLVPGGTSEEVTLDHTFEVKANDPADGDVNLRLVVGCLMGFRSLHVETAPLTWSARVVHLKENSDEYAHSLLCRPAGGAPAAAPRQRPPERARESSDPAKQ